MAFTARLAAGVEEEAKRYAERAGVSLNALLSIALRDYLDARQPMRPSGEPSPASSGAAPPAAEQVVLPTPPAVAWKAPKRPRDPCPCGSRQQWRHCHGKPLTAGSSR